jgi:hypothetical protein
MCDLMGDAPTREQPADMPPTALVWIVFWRDVAEGRHRLACPILHFSLCIPYKLLFGLTLDSMPFNTNAAN